MRLWNFLFGRRRRRVINAPEICGPRLCRSELIAALHGAQEDPRVRAVLWILVAQRTQCLDAASDDAHKGRDTRYQLGGMESLDDVFDMLTLLTAQGKVDDSLGSFFET